MYFVLKLFTCPSRQELLYNVYQHNATLFNKKKKLLLFEDIFVVYEQLSLCYSL